MNRFTRRGSVGDLPSPASRAEIFTRKAKLDSKGRLLIPIDIRRSFGLGSGSEVDMVFSLDKNLVILVIDESGQDGAAASIGARGVPEPGSSPGPDPDASVNDEGGEL
ncbi:MAG: AbrB/MazE/SpoVT family DNA-binding domain-containing protein [Candidatus Aenigmarchaeota archaeon]|nr:AbrB/MazE/SpoVT family DNA-binding domain-containing protein [Candidatus Aenigmarchaeota archaeon]